MKPSTPSTTISHKEAAASFLRLTATPEGVREAFDEYIAPTFRHHNTHFRGDRESLSSAMQEAANANPARLLEIRQVLEDGELVAVFSRVRQNPNDPDIAVVHIFRFEDDRVVELWDVIQPAPPDSPNENGMF